MMHQNIPAKKSFKLDDLSKELGVKKFIIKNWEKQFNCRDFGTDGKYSQEDYKYFAIIKDLIFNKKMSLSIAKKYFQDILEGKEPQVAQEIKDFKIIPTNSDHIIHADEKFNPTPTKTIESEPEPVKTVTDMLSIESEKIELKTSQETSDESSFDETSFKAAQEIKISQLETQPNQNEISDIKPAFKEKEEFFKNIRSFKEQLLKIQEQLK